MNGVKPHRFVNTVKHSNTLDKYIQRVVCLNKYFSFNADILRYAYINILEHTRSTGYLCGICIIVLFVGI